MGRLLVTLDTSALKLIATIKAALADVDHEIRVTTVSGRESPSRVEQLGLGQPVVEGGVWDETTWGAGVWVSNPPMVAEPFVLDESLIGGGGVIAGDESLLERILVIIDPGFPKPGKREHLSRGHHNQLRDAMILDAHARERRHLFVTGDAAAFIKDGRRERHEALCGTRIALPSEISDLLDSLDY